MRSAPTQPVLKSGRAVLNIKGNDFRLVTQINYAVG
ncbi:MAG: type II toxin-antitoxin system HigB family toxin [Proteobacteria bacterium]|nr:type II toxin-antitoxin system HigB family toxin [Pseudomonadota bacterium]